MVAKKDATIIRGFKKNVMNPNSNLNIFPGDYDLMRIGTFNPETGTIEPMTPQFVVSAQELYNEVLRERTDE